MDYLNFDYKKACSELTVRELETLLFKSRMIGVTKIITGCWKKYKPDDLIFITLFILYGSVVFLYSLLYATFEYLFYSIFRKNSKKDILRYSEIKWSQNHVKNILNDNEYTTFADIQKLWDIKEEIEEKIIEERKQKKQVEHTYEEKIVANIVKENEEQAEKNSDNIHQQNIIDAQNLCTCGFEYFKNEDYAKAIEELEKSCNLNDSNASSFYWCGRAYYEIGNNKKAIKKLERACELRDNDPWGYYWCGKAYHAIKDYKRAIKKLEIACELGDNDYEIFYECGYIYYYSKKYKKAAEKFEKACELNKDDYNNFYWCGDAYLHNGEYKKAVEKLEIACELSDNDFYCLHLCGDAYYKLGDHKKAFEKYDKNLESE